MYVAFVMIVETSGHMPSAASCQGNYEFNRAYLAVHRDRLQSTAYCKRLIRHKLQKYSIISDNEI